MQKYNKSFKSFITIIIAMFVLCFWAFYNTFPLLFSNDTAMYIEAGFDKIVEPDRPILYGLFIFLSSLQYSLWIVVFVQAFIVSLIVFFYFRYFAPTKNYRMYFLAFIIIVSFFMGASFDVSWIIADVFTSISILSIGLLLFVNNLKIKDFIIISFFLVISVSMHNSHFFICIGLLILFIMGLIFKPIKKEYKFANIKSKSIIYVAFLVILSHLLLSLVHYVYSGNFKSERGGIVFFMGNLVEMGVVDTYLAENCEKKNYEICLYKDTLPNNFLWASNSPIQKTGGWEGSADEYSLIVKDILTTPSYLKTVMYKSIVYTFKQFFYFDTGEANKHSKRTKTDIKRYYPNQYLNFVDAKQNRKRLNFDFINFVQVLIVVFCYLFYILIFLFNRLTIRYRFFISFILLGLFINAWFCSTFSGVFPRYQSRLVWTVPLPLFLYAAEFIDEGKIFQIVRKHLKELKSKIENHLHDYHKS